MRRGIRCALLFGAFLLALPATAVAFGPLGSFGGFGGEPGQLDSPQQLEVAANGDVYVADPGNSRISVFAGDGTFLRTFGEGVLQNPVDVAVAADGRVFVADALKDSVAVFSAAGEHVFDIDSAELTDPVGVALGGSTIYVAEGSDDSVVAYEDDGGFIDSLTMPEVPRDVIVGADGNLYVTAAGKVNVVTQAGALVDEFGDAQLDAPAALAMNGAGEIFVVDSADGAIERFDPAGNHLGDFSSGPEPIGVATACESNVFVVDKSLARVERFGEPGTLVPPCVRAPEVVSATLIPTTVSRLRFNRLKLNRSNGSAVLFVRVSGPGRVILKGRGVRRLRRGASRATIVRLPVKPKVRLRRFVKQYGKGRIRVEATFRPLEGEERSLERVVVLRRRR